MPMPVHVHRLPSDDRRVGDDSVLFRRGDGVLFQVLEGSHDVICEGETLLYRLYHD